MTNRPRALVLVNPKSRGDLPEEWTQVLAEAGVEPRIEWPDSPDETRRLIESAASERTIDCVVLAGGDGTIHQALPALLAARLPVALIPIGTANDLARSLELPEDPLAAFDVVAGGVPKRIDVGVANGVPFLNAASLGVGVRVNRELDGDTKEMWGSLSYLRAAWRAVRKERPFDVEIDCDGEHERVRCVHVAVGNGVYHGGGARVAEDASVSDGWLRLYTLPPSGLLKLASLVPWLRAGRQDRRNGVRSLRGRSIRLRTSRPLEVFADGERVSQTPVEFSILPGALDFLVPPGAPESSNGGLLRDQSEVALNELLARCLALADSYARLCESLEADDPSAADLFASLAQTRRRAANRLEMDVRRMNELPTAPALRPTRTANSFPCSHPSRRAFWPRTGRARSPKTEPPPRAISPRAQKPLASRTSPRRRSRSCGRSRRRPSARRNSS